TQILNGHVHFCGSRVGSSPYEQHFITAKSGQIVILPCLTPKKNIKFVHWSRADLEPEYLVLYKDGKFLPDNQQPSFKNRVDLQERQMKDGDVSLILNNVNTADKGTYQCHVFTEGARTWKTISIINLNVPPGKSVQFRHSLIWDSPQLLLGQWRGSPNNKKIKFIHWNNQHPSFKNRVDLQDIQMKDGDVSLILKNVNTADDGTYQCRVFMEETRSWKLSIINLNISLKEKTITAESGQNVTLTCQTLNYKILVVKWSRSDLTDEYVLLYQHSRFYPDNQHPSFKNRVDLQDRQMKDGDVSLILKDVNTADSGTYECRLTRHEAGRAPRALQLTRQVAFQVAATHSL
uniref:Ig-like domain-containing protein n=1 Tax=Maylandia zebra TaxID=106582 RepID=A0A3P9D8H8_9CICH